MSPSSRHGTIVAGVILDEKRRRRRKKKIHHVLPLTRNIGENLSPGDIATFCCRTHREPSRCHRVRILNEPQCRHCFCACSEHQCCHHICTSGSLNTAILFALKENLVVVLLHFLDSPITRNNTPLWTSSCHYYNNI
ncbi:hypothetical protein E2542_SST01235 [Spatholobus suberectus]|nr:hypothetical protein E2542_SST01235 [Spatholobus suberectus]